MKLSSSMDLTVIVLEMDNSLMEEYLRHSVYLRPSKLNGDIVLLLSRNHCPPKDRITIMLHNKNNSAQTKFLGRYSRDEHTTFWGREYVEREFIGPCRIVPHMLDLVLWSWYYLRWCFAFKSLRSGFWIVTLSHFLVKLHSNGNSRHLLSTCLFVSYHPFWFRNPTYYSLFLQLWHFDIFML